ncbi:hypothetical protein COLO4_34379 [Corchorus olitorius]|uniref:Uncharacterized protein n=1 Tax=Corchorus olitorius TaxID=93759 RepID=A0A1R3GL50_9ROSI|nr:hypothetical protein COLO4_34379 [Corchorus olitorius]
MVTEKRKSDKTESSKRAMQHSKGKEITVEKAPPPKKKKAVAVSPQESLSFSVPDNHFKDKWHQLRYESLSGFKLLGTKTLDWNSLKNNPECDEGDSEPPKGFDFNDAWHSISGQKEKFPDSQAKRKLLNVQAKLIHHFIATMNLAQSIINEMKKTASKKNSMHCGFGPIITALGEISSTKMHEHKDMQVVCSPLLDISQHRFVQTTVKDSQVAQAIESLINAIAISAIQVFFYAQLEDSDETPPGEGKQHKDSENVIEEEKEENLDLKEDNNKEKTEDDDDNIDVEVEDAAEQENDKGLEDDAEEELNQEGEDDSDPNQEEAMAQTFEEDDKASSKKAPSAAVGETNGKERLNLPHTPLLLPLSASSNPRRKSTKKATTATDKAPAHDTESDVVSEATKLPPAIPSK